MGNIGQGAHDQEPWEVLSEAELESIAGGAQDQTLDNTSDYGGCCCTGGYTETGDPPACCCQGEVRHNPDGRDSAFSQAIAPAPASVARG